MTIGFVNATAAPSAGAVNTVSLSYASTVAGDLLLIFANLSGLSTLSDPTGFTALTGGAVDQSTAQRTKCWYRIADGTESGSVSVAWTGTAQTAVAVMVAYRGVDPTTPVQVCAGASGASGTTHAAAAASPYSANGWQVCAFLDKQVTAAQSWTPTAGMSERVDSSSSVSAFMSIEVEDSNAVKAPSSGALVAVTSGASTQAATSWVGINIGLMPLVTAMIDMVGAGSTGPPTESFDGTRAFSGYDFTGAVWPTSGQGWPRVRQSQ